MRSWRGLTRYGRVGSLDITTVDTVRSDSASETSVPVSSSSKVSSSVVVSSLPRDSSSSSSSSSSSISSSSSSAAAASRRAGRKRYSGGRRARISAGVLLWTPPARCRTRSEKLSSGHKGQGHCFLASLQHQNLQKYLRKLI